MSYVTRKCHCGTEFQAKAADVARGWAQSCSKSCAASKREKTTGNYARYFEARSNAQDHDAACDAVEDGWDGHKNVI